MRRARPFLTIMALPVLIACVSGERQDTTALTERLRVLEERADLGARGGAGADDAMLHRLDADVRSLESRLSALEAQVQVLRGAAPAQAETNGAGAEARRESRRAQREDRRAALRALSAEYRARLTEVREEFGDDPNDPARQQALREVVDWYRAERHALMRAGR